MDEFPFWYEIDKNISSDFNCTTFDLYLPIFIKDWNYSVSFNLPVLKEIKTSYGRLCLNLKK